MTVIQLLMSAGSTQILGFWCLLAPVGTVFKQSIIGVIFRPIYNHIMTIIQLLMSAGSTQILGFWCLLAPVGKAFNVRSLYSVLSFSILIPNP